MSSRGSNRGSEDGSDAENSRDLTGVLEEARRTEARALYMLRDLDSDSDESSVFTDEEDEWEQDWESDSQEVRRPEPSTSERSSDTSEYSDSEDSIVFVPPPNANNQESNSARMTTVRRASASSDSDVEPTPRPKRRRIIEDSRESQDVGASTSEPVPENDDDPDAGCTICYEDYTSNGEHRLVSLKCGHFFGRSCIERWIRSEGRSAGCPNCKQKAQIRDVRVHFTKSVQMTDTSALEDLKKANFDLQEKNTRLEMELAKTRKELQELGNRLNDSNEVIKAVQLPAVVRCGRMVLKQWIKLSLAPPSQSANSRAFDINGTTFAVGVKCASGGPFGQYGIRRATIDWNRPNATFTLGAVNCLHTNRNKVVAFSPYQHDQVLSAGEDGKAVVHQMDSGQVRPRTYNVSGTTRGTIWSACWLSPTTFAIGLQHGNVLEFDISTNDQMPRRVITARRELGMMPIIFLAHDPESSVLLVASFKKMVAFYRDAAFPLLSSEHDGFVKIRNVAWDPRTLSFMVTLVDSHSTISHRLYKLEVEEHTVHVTRLGSWDTQWTKAETMWDNCLFSIKDYGTFSLVYDQDHELLEAHDWSGQRPNVILPLPRGERVSSMKAFTSPSGQRVIAVLTEQTIYTLQFSLSE